MDIFGGEEKKNEKEENFSRGNVLFFRGGDELGRTIFGEGQYFFAEEKNTEKENIFYGGEGKEKNIWKGKYMFCVRTEKPRGKRRKI